MAEVRRNTKNLRQSVQFWAETTKKAKTGSKTEPPATNVR